MTSLFAQLFIAVQAQIKNHVPEILWIDQDLGQLEYYETRPAVAFPCALIDFPQAQYNDEGGAVQWVAVSLSVRLAFSPFSSANAEAPDISKEAALQFYEIENKLYEALQGFTAGDCIQPLTRISATTERREDPFRIREIVFTTATEDDTAKPVTVKRAAALDIDTDL